MIEFLKLPFRKLCQMFAAEILNRAHRVNLGSISFSSARSHAAGQIARALARGRDISNLKLDFRSNHLDDEFVLKLRDLLTSAAYHRACAFRQRDSQSEQYL